MNKVLIFGLIFILSSAFNLKQSQGLKSYQSIKACAEIKCTQKVANCDETCESKLKKAMSACGEKVAPLCYSMYIGVSGPGVDLATCIANSGCLDSSLENVNCYERKCLTQFKNCVGEKECRTQLVSCKSQKNTWEFNSKCIEQKASKHLTLYQFYTCAGQNKCL